MRTDAEKELYAALDHRREIIEPHAQAEEIERLIYTGEKSEYCD